MLGRLVMRGCGIPASTRIHHVSGVHAVLVEDPRIALWFRAHLMPVQAQTLGRYVLSRDPLPPDTLAHEIEHVRQWERFGPSICRSTSVRRLRLCSAAGGPTGTTDSKQRRGDEPIGTGSQPGS
jgi:hypothetical protein